LPNDERKRKPRRKVFIVVKEKMMYKKIQVKYNESSEIMDGTGNRHTVNNPDCTCIIIQYSDTSRIATRRVVRI
jgi:hypothetical protein